MVKTDISPDQNRKEAFCEIAFRCVNATHRVTRFSSGFCLLTQFSGNLQWDTCERNEACGNKGNILRWKLEGRFVRNFLVMCEFISQNYTSVSCSSTLTLYLRTWEGLLWIALKTTIRKEISSAQNVKEAFWETSLWSVNSSHRVIGWFSESSLLTLFSWNLPNEIGSP